MGISEAMSREPSVVRAWNSVQDFAGPTPITGACYENDDIVGPVDKMAELRARRR